MTAKEFRIVEIGDKFVVERGLRQWFIFPKTEWYDVTYLGSYVFSIQDNPIKPFDSYEKAKKWIYDTIEFRNNLPKKKYHYFK